MMMFAVLLVWVYCGRVTSFTTTTELRSLAAKATREATASPQSPALQHPPQPDEAVQFYGKLVNTCDEAAGGKCFSAVVAGGRTNFGGDGGDLANIYVPENDYDTWRQQASGRWQEQVEGEFVYQLQNSTLSCLTVQLRWWFGRSGAAGDAPHVGCQAVSLAANWDCHLDWAVAAECAWNAETQQAEALYTVVNLGPEQAPGVATVFALSRSDGSSDGSRRHVEESSVQRISPRR